MCAVSRVLGQNTAAKNKRRKRREILDQFIAQRSLQMAAASSRRTCRALWIDFLDDSFYRGLLCMYVSVCVCVCVCVRVFIKLHITAQSGLVILVILCHSH